MFLTRLHDVWLMPIKRSKIFKLEGKWSFHFLGIRSRVEHTAELKETSIQERHLAAAPQIPYLTQDQLLMRMNADVKPIPMLSHAMPPFVSASMVAMTTPQPTIVWLPYPSPPPSPTEKSNEVADSAIKKSTATTKGDTPTVTSLSNTILPVWRPWWPSCSWIKNNFFRLNYFKRQMYFIQPMFVFKYRELGWWMLSWNTKFLPFLQ